MSTLDEINSSEIAPRPLSSCKHLQQKGDHCWHNKAARCCSDFFIFSFFSKFKDEQAVAFTQSFNLCYK